MHREARGDGEPGGGAGPVDWAVWGRAFRPFFLLAGLQAVGALGLWLGVLRGYAPVPGWSSPNIWHAHEMVFGFAGAAVAGFLLTSVPVWTGLPAWSGARLIALVALWVSGRLAVLTASSLPAVWLAPLLDVSFLVVVAFAIGVPIHRARSRRNRGFPLLLLTLATANLLTHLGAQGPWPELIPAGLRLGVGTLLLLVSVLGGRLIPLFTKAALQRAGRPGAVTRVAWADVAAAPLLASFVLADTLVPDSSPSAALALLAAIVLALRARGWGFRAALGDPLLWSMHVAYGWIPLGLLGVGLAAFTPLVPHRLATHALTVGAIGGMILAIMSRVALGHTGRPFRAPGAMTVAYLLVLAAGIARSLAPLLWPTQMGSLVLVSGALWIGGFAIFLAIYTPYLLAPRVDGEPG